MANADTALFKPELVFFDMECKDREDFFNQLHDKLDAILSLLHRFGIKEVARTGSVAMRRSKKCE